MVTKKNSVIHRFRNFVKSSVQLAKLCNPFDMSTVVRDIKKDTASILNILDIEVIKINELERELSKVKLERRRYQDMIRAIGNTIPDMMWFKDSNGRYVYVNKTIRTDLFYSLEEHEVLGKTDVELAEIFREKVGKENHTFGEVCGSSDEVILKNQERQKFLEYGKINGNLVYLIVHKAPMYENGILAGTVGTGRDVTELYTNLSTLVNSCDCISPECKNKLMNVLDVYKYDGSDKV